MPVGIRAVGGYVPPTVISNATIAEWASTTEEWINTKTGISERRYADPETPTSTLAYRAVLDLLQSDPDALRHLRALILATSTPDQPQPPTAIILQGRLGLSPVPAFDVDAVCSGFVYALVIGAALVETADPASQVLVVAADKYSAIMDRRDRRTATLFGDGAGAVLLAHVPPGFGLRSSKLVAHGEYRDVVEVLAGGTRRPLDERALRADEHLFRMRGHDVAEYVLQALPDLIAAVLREADLTAADIDRWIFHQANPRLVQALTHTLAIDADRVPLTGPIFGNSGCASLPVTLHHSHAQKPLARGEHLLLAAVGGGLSAGAAVLTWY